MKPSLADLFEGIGYDFDRAVTAFPEARSLRGVPQNPQWHAEGDVFVHTRCVCRALTDLPGWRALDRREKAILYLAALFHDIGKRVCTTTEDGLIVSPFHAVTGANIFREMVYLRYESLYEIDFAAREQAAALIRWHGLPPLFLEKEPLTRTLLRARETAHFPLLFLLAKADLLGRQCDACGEMLEIIEYFREYTGEQGFYDRPYPFASSYTRYRYFQGDAVWPGAALYDATTFAVHMLSGLPLAGKDAYLGRHFPGLPVISPDDIRAERGLAPAEQTGKVIAEAKARARALLQRQQPFVWNATNIVRETRQGLYDLFAAYGAGVRLIYIETPYAELLRRNGIRSRSVPVPVLSRMVRKLDVPEPAEAYRVSYHSGLDGAVLERN